MAYSVLQSKSAAVSTGGSNTQAITFTNNVVSSSKIVVIVRTTLVGGVSTSTVKDGAANSWTKLGSVTSAGQLDGELSAWALTTPSGDVGTKPTMTATFNSSNVTESSMTILEVSGLTTDNTTGMLDGSVGNATGTTSGSHSVSGTTTTATAEFLCIAYGDNGNNSTVTYTSPFTKDSGSDPSTITTTAAGHKDSTNGAESGSVSNTAAGNWELLIFCIKLSAVVNNPFKNPVSYCVQTGVGGRAARRRIGTWHFIADRVSSFIDYPVSRSTPTSIVLRSKRIGYRVVTPADSNILGLSSTIPVLNSVSYYVQQYRSGRAMRRRSATVVNVVASQGAYIYSGTQNPETNTPDVMILSNTKGRRPRQRSTITARTDTASFTSYLDNVISKSDNRSWFARVARFRNNDFQVGEFFANLSQYVYPPHRKLAESFIASTYPGKPARRRVGFWHTIAHQHNTQLSGSAETIQTTISHSPVVAMRGGRKPRKLGDWYIIPGTSNTAYLDNVLSVAKPRSLGYRIGKFNNNEQPGSRLGNWLNQPFKKLAEWFVAAGFAGRPARRRVGYWHTIADAGNTLLQSEIPSLGNYSVWVLSGKIRSRRRWSQNLITSSNTNTSYQDQVSSQPKDRFFNRSVARTKHSDHQPGMLYTVLSGFVPFKKLALYMVQSLPGGRPARRRVGMWHYVADQSNTSLGASGELPSRMIADISVMSGRIRGRRRYESNFKGSQETNTTYRDVRIAHSRSYKWSRSSPSPSYLFNVQNKVNYFVKFFVNLTVVQPSVLSVIPGLFRSSGAFVDAIKVQFRPFVIGMINRIDKSR